jgi:hypothetical protein
MVENVVAFYYPVDPASASRATKLLEGLPTQSQEVIFANMKKATSLTLRILKSLYPQANMDAMGKDFAATCTDDEANKLMEDSTMMACQIMEMFLVDMS